MAAEHKHGTMDTTVQQKTFDGFMNFTIKTAIALMVLAIFLAIFAS